MKLLRKYSVYLRKTNNLNLNGTILKNTLVPIGRRKISTSENKKKSVKKGPFKKTSALKPDLNAQKNIVEKEVFLKIILQCSKMLSQNLTSKKKP